MKPLRADRETLPLDVHRLDAFVRPELRVQLAGGSFPIDTWIGVIAGTNHGHLRCPLETESGDVPWQFKREGLRL